MKITRRYVGRRIRRVGRWFYFPHVTKFRGVLPDGREAVGECRTDHKLLKVAESPEECRKAEEDVFQDAFIAWINDEVVGAR